MLTALAIAAIVLGAGGLTVGGIGLSRTSKQDVALEQARTDAVEAAAQAGADAAREVLAPEMARVDSLATQLDKLPAAYCDGASTHYNEAACLAERVCTRAGLTGDGNDAVGCERALNAWLSGYEISTIETNPDPSVQAERSKVFQRRK